MVGKVTSGSSFSGLAAYLTGDRERVAWIEARWMIGTDPKEIAREMEAAAGQSSRVEKPVYHISISFDPADTPTREQMQEAASQVLKDLGLDRHQESRVLRHPLRRDAHRSPHGEHLAGGDARRRARSSRGCAHARAQPR